MFRLNATFGAALLLLSGCGRQPSSQTEKISEPHSLPELLRAHDMEVARHGKDIAYIRPIGGYGREGVLAVLDHIEQSGKAVSSYNSIEVIFGVAEEARTSKGYDICYDKTTLNRLHTMGKSSNTPAYQQSMYDEFLGGYCKANVGKAAD